MKFKFAALLVVLPALIAGALVSTPAEAAGYAASVKTKTVAMYSSDGVGIGRVLVKCSSSKTCKGTLSFPDDAGTPYIRNYSVAARSSAYVTVAMHLTADIYPANSALDGGDYTYVPNVRLTINENAPYNHAPRTYTDIRTETLVSSQQIKGNVSLDGSPKPTNVRVELLSIVKGGSTIRRFQSPVLTDGDAFGPWNVKLGTNNAPSSPYYLRITGYDQDGAFRSWFWRGTTGNPLGGGKFIREASTVSATKTGDYVADFKAGAISGDVTSITGKADVTVAAPPTSVSSSSVVNRDMDFPGCANVFGRTDVTAPSGSYTVNFLPYIPNSNRYMVRADDHTSDQARWNGEYGSCWDVLNYVPGSTTNLIALNSGGTATAPDSDLTANPNSLVVNPDFSTSPTRSDTFIRLREKIPNTSIIDAPVVAEGFPNDTGHRREFTNLPAGSYWVEVGRRTGCSDWYRSVYSDNNLYFKGEDRSAERWKAFRKLNDLSGGQYSGLELIARTVQPNPATETQNTSRSGYRGWMYRGYCGAYSAGKYSSVVIDADENILNMAMGTVPKGATVTGKVKRGGGRTNKEMMVSLYPSGRSRVIRTDLTDGSGRFSIKGLAPGSYRIVVNADSWRGITRTFSGRHSITVSGSKSYGVGTLYFQNQSDTADSD